MKQGLHSAKETFWPGGTINKNANNARAVGKAKASARVTSLYWKGCAGRDGRRWPFSGDATYTGV